MKKALMAVIFAFVLLLTGCSFKPDQKFVDELNYKTDYKNVNISEYTIADSQLYINGGVKINNQISPNYYLWKTDKLYLSESLSALTIYFLDIDSILEYSDESYKGEFDYNKLINNLLNRQDFELSDFEFSRGTYTLTQEFLNEFYEENGIQKVDNLIVSFEYKKEIKKLHIGYSNHVDINISFASGSVSNLDVYVKDDNMEIDFKSNVENKVIKTLTIDGYYKDKAFTAYTKEDTKGRIASSNLHSKEEKNSISAFMLIKTFLKIGE